MGLLTVKNQPRASKATTPTLTLVTIAGAGSSNDSKVLAERFLVVLVFFLLLNLCFVVIAIANRSSKDCNKKRVNV